MTNVLLDGLFVFDKNLGLVLAMIAIIFSIGYALNSLFGTKSKQGDLSIYIPLFLFLSISLLLRLAYLRNVYAPQYFDSPEHFRIIKTIIERLRTSSFLDSFSELTRNYYHFGFHTLTALLTIGLRANPIDVMLVFGQSIIAMLPIPVFFLVWKETQSQKAAFFSAILAGFGWYMPAFAINWGKYPAITGLLAFKVTLLLIAYFGSQKHYLAKGIQAISVFISIFIHSRTLVLFLISFLGYFLSCKIFSLGKKNQHKVLRIELLSIFIFGILIYQEPLLKLALEPYIDKGIWITVIVFLLALFALQKHHQTVHFTLIFILFLFAGLFISVDKILPGFEAQTLLDRPFVEMSLYFPLSILGGVGFSGLLQSLKNIKNLSKRVYKSLIFFTVSILFILVGFLIAKNYNFYPSECCNFLNYDDTIAFEWINNNLPTNTSILIASNRLNVLPFTKSTDLVGSDAGIWIPQLINRKTIMAPYELDFLSSETRGFLCRNQANYIYVGYKAQSFDPKALLQKREWYQKILSLPNAQLFQLTNCFERK